MLYIYISLSPLVGGKSEKKLCKTLSTLCVTIHCKVKKIRDHQRMMKSICFIRFPIINRKDANTYAKFAKRLNYVPYPKRSTFTKTKKSMYLCVLKKTNHNLVMLNLFQHPTQETPQTKKIRDHQRLTQSIRVIRVPLPTNN